MNAQPLRITLLTLAILAIAAVAVFWAVSGTQADTTASLAPDGLGGYPAIPEQGTGNTGNTDGYTNLNTYPDPQPCGPGAGAAFMQEPHELTTGHYALFDAYWRTISEGSSVAGTDLPGVGVLHTNLCPPEMVEKTQGRKTVIARSARTGGMDVDEIIMHVRDTHKEDVVDTNAQATAGQLSLAEYPRVDHAVDAGDKVWWLQLDDPDTTDADETSDLGIGFSTALLDDDHWLTSAEGKPLRYKFEVERHPADPTDVPHFFAYEAPKANGAAQVPIWDSSKPGEGAVELDPGEYKELQWVFTKPGTYLLWVHLLGVVRDDARKPADADDDWKPISGNETETSEVYRYTIQVGDTLDETEPPIFGVNREVEENSLGGVRVGDPIPVYNAEADVLYYDLTGEGHSKFELVPDTDSHTVQIVVAEGASLDYEDEDARSYELNLTVTDRVDHEHNFDPYADDVLIVRIDLEDQYYPGLLIEANGERVRHGETVEFLTWYEPTTDQIGQTPRYQWEEYMGTDADGRPLWHVIPDAFGPSWFVVHSSTVTKIYRATVVLEGDDPTDLTYVNSDFVTVTWGP